ncbi:uncharacterized protein LOC110827547 isoform X2 [Zootermopsis nevadensis]|uniref:uncharacterized protein LOC110827547 isoform X2 n=1 Tax=Zootermopsis nevadensis TaxID=136037 RepID=UPI000B8E88E6|nr:uncharacterized protein LOC110827547 isoform X2 [Zootermopsis nevadensis]
MDFQSAMETFAEAWVAANTKGGSLSEVGCSQTQAMALTNRGCRTPPASTPPPPQAHRAPEPPPPPVRTPPPTPPQQEAALHPSPKESYELSKSNSGKSLPVHCVVEAVSALEDSRLMWRRKPVVETDSYVIIPVNTAFQDLVQVALHRLGYPRDSASAAKVVIKNWKPLSFEKIAEGPTVTVGDILGELTTVATLRIQLYRARPSILSDIKDKLLRLLLAQSHGLLLSSGCPLDEITLSHLCRSPHSAPGNHVPEPSEECRRKFEQWWTLQLTQQQHQHHGTQHHSTPRPQSGPQYSPGGSSHHISTPNKLLDRPPSLPESVHPALQTVQSQYPTQKTRMRTSFDPELELPKLQRWFAENQHPSRQQIQQYVKELNGLESRRGRKPLDINNVVYWFKNARAAQKRAELRSVGPGLPCHISLNGYNSSSHSPTHAGSLMLGQEGLLPPGIKSPSTPLNSPTRGQLFLSDHQSENSNDPAVTSDQEDEDDNLRLDPRIDITEHRGDPRDDLRAAEDREPDSPTAPLSLTTNDKGSTGTSPKPSNLPEMGGIKQEPPDEITSSLSSNNNNNNNNNRNNKDCEEISDVDEDEDDEDPDDLEERRNKEEIDHDEEEIGTMHPARIGDLSRQQERLHSFRSPSPSDMIVAARGPPSGGPPNLDRLAAAGFPLVPNSMFSHSIMYMSHYIPSLAHQHHGHHGLGPATPPSSSGGLNLSALAASADERRKRNRTFIDPVTEVPRLEQWFSLNTHPSHNLILKYTEELNRMPYRQKFPRLEPKNVQFWFKNRRAKCKRLKMSLFETPQSAAVLNHHQLPYHQSPGSDPLHNRD